MSHLLRHQRHSTTPSEAEGTGRIGGGSKSETDGEDVSFVSRKQEAESSRIGADLLPSAGVSVTCCMKVHSNRPKNC